jgi:hypothetical protein
MEVNSTGDFNDRNTMADSVAKYGLEFISTRESSTKETQWLI